MKRMGHLTAVKTCT